MTNNVVRFTVSTGASTGRKGPSDTTTGGGNGGDGMLEAKVGRLEDDMKEIRSDMKAVRSDLAEIKGKLSMIPGYPGIALVVGLVGTAMTLVMKFLPTMPQP